MPRPPRSSVPHHGGALRLALFVLILMAGLVGMHGLGPVVDMAGAVPAASMHQNMSEKDMATGSSGHGSPGDDGHSEHADATCKAGGVGAGVVLPAVRPDIIPLSGWLETWGEPVPKKTKSDGTDHSGHGMSGMMSDQEMKKLEETAGRTFDTASSNS